MMDSTKLRRGKLRANSLVDMEVRRMEGQEGTAWQEPAIDRQTIN